MLVLTKSAFLWQKDDSWWGYNEDGRTVHLNDNAPDYAKKSFEEYEKLFDNKPRTKDKIKKAS